MQSVRSNDRVDLRTRELERAAAVVLLFIASAGCGGFPESGSAGDVSATATPVEAQTQQQPLPLQARQLPPFCVTCSHVLTRGPTPTPASLAITSTTVFWSGMESTPAGWQPGIFSAPITGGPMTTFLATNELPNSLAALDGWLYWQQIGGDGGTWMMAQSGGTATKFVQRADSEIAQRQGVAVQAVRGIAGLPVDLVLSSDPDNSDLWEFRSTIAPRRRTTTALIAGTERDFTGPQQGAYYPNSVTMDATNAYFVAYREGGDALNAVYQLSLSGGTPTTIGMAQVNSPIAVYGGNVYFVVGNAIESVPVGGGATPIVFATDDGPPTTFAVDSGNLYWTCTSLGTVSKRSFTGTVTTNIASGEQAPEYLAVGPSNVYWGATGAIRYQAK